jgi:hypothetical protein
MNSTIFNKTSSHVELRGWVSQPQGRGTLDILVSCGITIFLCIWTSVCVNVPAPGHGPWDIFLDRWHMFCLGLLGPEFVLLLAVGQYCLARSSWTLLQKENLPDDVRKKLKPDLPEWTMKHSFFADMGGILLESPEFPSFPINAKQLHYLIVKGYIPFPVITEETINDKNKADGLTRLVKCWIHISYSNCLGLLQLPKCFGSRLAPSPGRLRRWL